MKWLKKKTRKQAPQILSESTHLFQGNVIIEPSERNEVLTFMISVVNCHSLCLLQHSIMKAHIYVLMLSWYVKIGGVMLSKLCVHAEQEETLLFGETNRRFFVSHAVIAILPILFFYDNRSWLYTEILRTLIEVRVIDLNNLSILFSVQKETLRSLESEKRKLHEEEKRKDLCVIWFITLMSFLSDFDTFTKDSKTRWNV